MENLRPGFGRALLVSLAATGFSTLAVISTAIGGTGGRMSLASWMSSPVLSLVVFILLTIVGASVCSTSWRGRPWHLGAIATAPCAVFIVMARLEIFSDPAGVFPLNFPAVALFTLATFVLYFLAARRFSPGESPRSFAPELPEILTGLTVLLLLVISAFAIYHLSSCLFATQ